MTSAATLVMLVAVAACVGPGRACTQIGGANLVVLDVAPDVRADLTSLHLELCQPEVCGDVTFSTTTPTEPSVHVQDGVTFDANRYTVDLRTLGKEWEADAPSRLTVEGESADGTEVVQRTESFEFDQSYPNGRGCDPDPYLNHATRVGDRDRTE